MEKDENMETRIGRSSGCAKPKRRAKPKADLEAASAGSI